MKMRRIIQAMILAILLAVSIFIALGGHKFARAQRHGLFHSYCAEGNTRGVTLLLRMGADPNGRWDDDYYYKYGWTVAQIDEPLLVAASMGQTDVVQILLNHGAKIPISDKEGFTPRNIAKFYGHDNVVKLIDKHTQK
ncbi:MAG: ankyrin repeat domain-containing protein [Proteobacteria bacterium]|nr:MAG: ankyrin repeat domain-containing protein [Pseudomonadota bacterium]